MAELDFVSIIVPSLIAGIISFLIIGINKLGRASDGTLSGTIKLEHVSMGMKQLEERMDKNTEKIQESITKVWEELDEIRSDQKLSTYRLDRLERNGNIGT